MFLSGRTILFVSVGLILLGLWALIQVLPFVAFGIAAFGLVECLYVSLQKHKPFL